MTWHRLLPLAISGLAVVSLILATIVLRRDAASLAEAGVQPRWGLFLAALGVVFANHLAQSLTWHLLTQALGRGGRLLDDFRRFSLGSLTRNLPGAFYWSTATRLMLYRTEGRTTDAALASGVELILQAGTGLALAAALLLWPWGLLPAIALLALAGQASLRRSLVSTLAGSRLARRWPGLAQHAGTLAALEGRTLAVTTAITAATWLTGGVYVEFLARAISLPVPDRPLLYGAWILASLAGLLGSVALGGFGILRELSLTGLLARSTSAIGAGWLAILTRVGLIVGTWLAGLVVVASCELITRWRTRRV